MSIAKLLDLVSRGIEYLCALFFLLMCSCLTLQVVARYTVADSFFWAEELARYAMIWIVYLGAVVAVRRKAHTRIDFFVNILPRRLRRFTAALVDAACIAFLLIVLTASQPLLKIGLTMKSTALHIPVILVYGALPLCSVLMILYFLAGIVADLRGGHDGEGGQGRC